MIDVTTLGVYPDGVARNSAAVLNRNMADQASQNGIVNLLFPGGKAGYVMEASLTPPIGVPVVIKGDGTDVSVITRKPAAAYQALKWRGSGGSWARPFVDGIGFSDPPGGAGSVTLAEIWHAKDGEIGSLSVEGAYAVVGLHLREWFNNGIGTLRSYFTGGIRFDATGPFGEFNGNQIDRIFGLDNKGPLLRFTGDATNQDNSQATNVIIGQVLCEEGTGMNATTAPIFDFDYAQDIIIGEYLMEIGSNRSGMIAPIRMGSKNAGARPVRIRGTVDYVTQMTTPPLYDVDHTAGVLDNDLSAVSSYGGHPSVAHVHIGQYVDPAGHVERRVPNPSPGALPWIKDDRPSSV